MEESFYQYSFEKLEAGKEARVLSKLVYSVSEDFPSSEKYGLTNQLRRSAISVASNLAEGSGKITSKDKARYLSIAFGSLMELVNQIILAKDLDYLDTEQYTTLRLQCDKVAIRINGLRKVFS